MSVQAIGWVFDHETETGGLTRLVLLSLANHANDVGECWPSKATIGRETNCQREPSIRAALRELEKRGLVETVVNGAPDARVPVDKRPNLYRLTFMAGRRSASTGDGAGRRFSSERVDGFRASGATDTVYQTIIEPSENHHRETRESDIDSPVDNAVRKVAELVAVRRLNEAQHSGVHVVSPDAWKRAVAERLLADRGDEVRELLRRDRLTIEQAAVRVAPDVKLPVRRPDYQPQPKPVTTREQRKAGLAAVKAVLEGDTDDDGTG